MKTIFYYWKIRRVNNRQIMPLKLLKLDQMPLQYLVSPKLFLSHGNIEDDRMSLESLSLKISILIADNRSHYNISSIINCFAITQKFSRVILGYGHISPSTNTGRAITIVYAIFGIPMFLIILADFGKLFTRGIKFLWAFVRRLYYTGSCRKVRRTVPVQVRSLIKERIKIVK